MQTSHLPLEKNFMKSIPLLLILAFVVAGCPITEDQDTPVPQVQRVEPRTKSEYWMYVPSYYNARRLWPLVITLHGTPPWDTSTRQIKQWKALAEREGFIVVAPELEAVEGILPVGDPRRVDQLQEDERTILSVLQDVAGEYRVDRRCVMLTGFSGGGYPLYYVGMRNPQRFQLLVARACNSDIDMLETVGVNDENRDQKIFIFWGKDDLKKIRDECWQAFRYFRRRDVPAEMDVIDGGHQGHPPLAYRYWEQMLPEAYR